MKVLKVFLIIIFALILVVGGLILADYLAKGFDLGIFDDAVLEEKTYEVSTPFSTLKIDCDVADVEVVLGDSSTVKIETKNREGMGFTHKVEGDTLLINQVDSRPWYNLFGIYSKRNVVKVYLPASFNGNLSVEDDTGDVKVTGLTLIRCSIESDTGDITINNLTALSSEIDSDTGDINADGIKGGSYDVGAETGNITLKNVEVETLSLEVETGDITLENGKLTKKLQIEGETGEISLKKVYAENLDVKNETGDVTFVDLDGYDIKIENDSGDVRGNILTNKIYDIHTSSGDVNFPRPEEGGGRCYVRTRSGDVDIK